MFSYTGLFNLVLYDSLSSFQISKKADQMQLEPVVPVLPCTQTHKGKLHKNTAWRRDKPLRKGPLSLISVLREAARQIKPNCLFHQL